ncbi:unnamed protein product [Durusdinium trenchii]|uniref:Uncharacterized protein n=1 Tax=Durusdinium trenchii TaxID=1381693 RepID=A0ABP0Q432_9DINO
MMLERGLMRDDHVSPMDGCEGGHFSLKPDELESDGHELTRCQRCGIGTLCLVLTCYFLPMLSFIPLALFGGVQTPSPWQGQYNKDAPVPVMPSKEMPSGRWYWNLPLVSLILVLLPAGIIFTMYQLKMRSLRHEMARPS